MDLKHTLISSNDDEKAIFSRRLYGTERLAATVAQEVDGCGHMFIGCLATCKSTAGSIQLMEFVKQAWIRTRFDAPWVAQRASKVASQPKSWIHTYETSSQDGFDVALLWASETVIWRDEIYSLVKWEEVLLSAYWKPNDGRFGMEWHVAKAPGSGEYFIMASIAHWLSDGRGLLQVGNLFFNYLRSEMQGGLVLTKNLPWGEEIARLSPASVLAVDHDSQNVKITIPEPPTTLKRFVHPLVETPNWKTIPARQTDVMLSRKETSELHSICKSRKVTVTSLLNSLCIIADVYTVLEVARNQQRLQAVLKDFESAEAYVVQNNLADRRSLLSRDLPSVTGPGGFGNLVIQITPTVHSMDDIRNIIQIPSHSSPEVNTACDAFWNGLVAGSDLAQKANKRCTPEAFVANEHALDMFTPIFDKSMFLTPGIGSTSIGKLSALGLSDHFLPSVAGSDTHSPLVIRELAMAFRATGPDCLHITAMIWEYDEEITIHLLASPRWHSAEAWTIFEESLRNSLAQVLRVFLEI